MKKTLRDAFWGKTKNVYKRLLQLHCR